MKIKDIINFLEYTAPPSLQESYDNSGLITGSSHWDCTGAVVCLDATPAVIEEAISNKYNLVIAHHPIVFKGLKKITGKTYVEEVIIKSIKNDVAIYAIHTNLDNVLEGVNGRIAAMLGLHDISILAPKKQLLQKLVVFVPDAHKEIVLNAMFSAGAGNIGNYSECSFTLSGEGSFKPGDNSNPFAGTRGVRQTEPESRIEVIFPAWKATDIMQAMKKAHPYEEVAYYSSTLENNYQEWGSGIVGSVKDPEDEQSFLARVKDSFGLSVIRHTPLLNKTIKKVALCGGSGIFLINDAIHSGADIYITSDVKYHEFFDADGKILLADIGHYESEQFTSDLIVELIRQKFPNFAVLKTAVNTNPVHYYR